MSESKTVPTWMNVTLKLAAIYNIIFGLWAIFMPNAVFAWFGLKAPVYPEFWQCIGMIVGVYGIGYWIASTNPARHWPIVLVGLLGKIFGPIGFAQAVWLGTLPLEFGYLIVFNDLVWWLPFAGILYYAVSEGQKPKTERIQIAQRDAIASATTNFGTCLTDLTKDQPVMLVFLRHMGCSFCRQAIADIAESRAAIEKHGLKIALVHMGKDEEIAYWLDKYDIADMPRISDPECYFYDAMGLERGKFMQLFGPSLWLPGLRAFLAGHHVGRLMGDGFRMPGVFVIKDGEVMKHYFHKNAAERPSYMKIALGE